MCKLKSAIVLKDRIFMPDYDSHERMIKELGLKDDYLGASKTFVRVELSPENGDVFSAIENWKLTVDQDIRPEWFFEDECKLLLIEKVKEWATTHILVGIDDIELSGESVCYIKDCKNVKACGSSSVKACGSSSVTAYDSSVITNSLFFTWKKQDDLILKDRSTFKDNYSGTIYQAGAFKFVPVDSGKTIGEQKGI